MKKLILLLLLFSAGAMLFAGGKREEPELNVTASGTQYISPDGNGVRDTAELSFRVELYAKSKSGYVPEYGVQIFDSAGNTVKEVIETEKSDIGWFARIFTKYSRFTLEKSVKWDGKDKNGNVVPEGNYDAKIWIKDPAGIVREASLDNFVVDVTAPDATLEWQDNPKFSPDGDGSLDFFEIRHIGASNEHLWKGEFYSSGNKPVRTYEWEGTPPERLLWDGKDNAGALLSDGTYSYRLNSTDLAGNKMGEKIIEEIIIDTRAPDLIFRISDYYISPDNDGIKDYAVVEFGHNDPEGLLEWEVFLSDMEGNIKASYSGYEAGLFEAIVDGSDKEGNQLPDGVYNAGFVSVYDNGVTISHKELITIDRKKPEISLQISNRVFSPGAGGTKEYTEISFSSNKPVEWKGAIKDERSGKNVIETSSDETTSLVVWDGKDMEGNDLSDGDYYLSAEFTDRAGNSFRIENEKITIRRTASEIDILVIPGAVRFFEGMDSTGIYFRVLAKEESDVKKWSLKIEDSAGNESAAFSGGNDVPGHVHWKAEQIPSEGMYNAFFRVEYNNGAIREKTIEGIVHDTSAPLIDLDISESPFVDIDGRYVGEVDIVIEPKEKYKYYGWEAVLEDPEGNTVISYAEEGDPESYLVWYGETDNDYVLKSGTELKLTVRIMDMAGNVGEVSDTFLFNVPIVRKEGKYLINCDDIIFSAYRSELDSRGSEVAKKNMESIRYAAAFHEKYPGFKIIIEGHALNVLLGSGTEREKREEEILQKLSLERAAAVRKELIRLGVPEANIEIAGFGGKEPVANVKDLRERWKNRRVIFRLDYNPGY